VYDDCVRVGNLFKQGGLDKAMLINNAFSFKIFARDVDSERLPTTARHVFNLYMDRIQALFEIIMELLLFL